MAKQTLAQYLEEINQDFFVNHLNANSPDSWLTEQSTHRHTFVKGVNPYPEEGVELCVCSCGVQVYYIEDDE